jgi:hypothetical protein
MASLSSTRTRVFISYSHADKAWLERLKRHLKPVVREGRLDYWDDTHIRPGDDWKQEIRTALDTAQVAVLLISADFFVSDFVNENELPPLLTAAEAKGVRILPVILTASRFARNPNLARFQAVNQPDRPLAEMPEAEQERMLDHLAQTIESLLRGVEVEPGRGRQRQMNTNAYDRWPKRRHLSERHSDISSGEAAGFQEYMGYNIDRSYMMGQSPGPPTRVASTPKTQRQRVDVPSVLGSLASLMIGFVVIVEAIAHWAFGTEAGWVAVVIPAALSVALTYLFRDSMRAEQRDEAAT